MIYIERIVQTAQRVLLNNALCNLSDVSSLSIGG